MTEARQAEDGSPPTRRERAQALANRPMTCPHEDRLSRHEERREEILAAHALAIEKSRPGYLDPATGLFVLSAAYLSARGYCCENGCRHCPYVE